MNYDDERAYLITKTILIIGLILIITLIFTL